MLREWLQHRFGWSLLLLLPLTLALLAASMVTIQFDADTVAEMGRDLPTMVAILALVGATLGSFVIVWLVSLFIASGIARRDHADRSVEFWLSLPISHGSSMAVPLGVHLLLAPAAALFIGLVCGLLLSLVLVTRMVGFGVWLDLPWALLLPAALSVMGRLLVGLPLATLWLLPLLLALVLARAWIGRWGAPVMLLALGLSMPALERLGLPQLPQAISQLLHQALQALSQTPGKGFEVHSGSDVLAALGTAPMLALRGAGMALQDLATPLFVLSLLVSAGLFALLLQWRQRGASRAD